MPAFQDFLQDLRFGVRVLRKEPLLTFAAVLSIGIGVAANTTVFTVANKVLFQPLAVDRHASLYSLYGAQKGQQPGETISFPDYRDLAAETSVFQSLAAYFPLVPANLTGQDGRPNRLWGQMVTGNYFDVAAVRPFLGRTFLPSEDQVPDRDFVVVLAHHTWRTKLGADPAIIGKTIRINQHPLTVIGVAAPGFRGADVGLIGDFWIPMSLHRSVASSLSEGREDRFTSRGNFWLFSIARLQPGVTLPQARAALDAISARLAQSFPDTRKDKSFYLEPAGQINPSFRASTTAFLALLLTVMLLVLLIACANVANLLLARSARRQREIGTRLALGAGRFRLIRQLLSESSLIALGGAALAILLTRAAQLAIARISFPFPVPIDLSTVIDWRVALFTLFLTFLTTITFGLAPALRAGRTDLVSSLRVLTADGASKPRRFRAANVLIVGQVAAALVLLTAAGLVLRSLRNAHTINLGFDPRNVYTISVDPVLDGVKKPQLAQLLPQLSQRLRAIPGVLAVSYCDLLPLSIGGQSTTVRTERSSADAKTETISADITTVGEEFAEAMGMKPLAGATTLSARPGAPVPTLINEELARKLWPATEATGRVFYRGDKPHQVAAVLQTTKMRSLGEAPRPAFFPILDDTFSGQAIFGFRLLVRTDGSVPADRLRLELQSAFPTVSVYDIARMEDHIASARILPRMAAVVFGFAGFTAILLAVTGLFGVIHYGVSRRSREFGIRMALGAGSGRILRLVLRQGAILATTGIALGFAAALASAQLLQGILYGISPTDPFTFTAVPATLLAVALLASLLPAWRASRLLPSSALREE